MRPIARSPTRALGVVVTLWFAPMPASAQPADIAAILQRYQHDYAAGNYQAALTDAQRLEAAVKARYGSKDINYATALSAEATVYEALGRLDAAEDLFKRALIVEEQALGGNGPTSGLAALISNLATVYDAQRKYSEAEPLYRRAVSIYEKLLGPSDPQLAMVLNNLADNYWRQGKNKDAEQLYKRALAIFALRPDQPELANCTESKDFPSIVLENQIFVEIHWPVEDCDESQRNGG
jgi:tetratricopeptide (TPR) repeat protein